MTANQIKAAELFERKRSNLVNESLGRDTLTETGRHNRVTETETARHNVRGESLDAARISESRRHNIQSEALESQRNAETQRHNMYGTEVIDRDKLTEAERHNRHSEIANYISSVGSILSGGAKAISMFM
jgi:hypothetical protein